MNKAVFLDRDGVITRSLIRDGRPYAPTTLEEFDFLPGVGRAIQDLKNAGYRIVVVTNQPDVATGLVRRDVVESMHERLRAAFPVDAIKVCYHTDQDGCACRKPKPGMLVEAAAELQIDLARSFMVGDRWRDIGAGKSAGCRTILIDSAYEERQADSPDAVAADLLQACTLILSERA